MMVLSLLSQKPKFLAETDLSVLRLGRDIKNRDIHMTRSELLRHTLVLGTSKSGRCDLLLSIMKETFGQASGGIFINGNGDPDILKKVAAMADATGNNKKLHVLDFRAGAVDPAVNFDPFVNASPAMAMAIIEDVVSDVGDTRQARAGMLTIAGMIVEALCCLRDRCGEQFDLVRLIDYTDRKRLEKLAERNELDASLCERIKSYLSETSLDDHGYPEMLLHLRLGPSAWHPVFDNTHEEHSDRPRIDIAELLARRDYLLVLLPALEMACGSIATYARLVVATFKATLAAILHQTAPDLPEFKVDTLDRKSKIPFICLFDDAPYYLPPNSDMLMAHARALGLGVVMGSGDLSATFSERHEGAWPHGIRDNLATTVIFSLETWHHRLDELLASCVIGRKPFPKVTGTNPFASARLFVKGLAAYEFVAVNSHQMVFGRN